MSACGGGHILEPLPPPAEEEEEEENEETWREVDVEEGVWDWVSLDDWGSGEREGSFRNSIL